MVRVTDQIIAAVKVAKPSGISVGTHTLPVSGVPALPALQCMTDPVDTLDHSSRSPDLLSQPDSHPLLRHLLTRPEWAYLRAAEPVTPPVSPQSPPDNGVHHTPLPVTWNDPMLSSWSPTQFPAPLPMDASESVYSGSETDRGFCNSSAEANHEPLSPCLRQGDLLVIPCFLLLLYLLCILMMSPNLCVLRLLLHMILPLIFQI